MAGRNGNKTCRAILTELLSDDAAHTAEDVYNACDGYSPTTVTNTLSALIAEGAIVRQVAIRFQMAPNRRKSNG